MLRPTTVLTLPKYLDVPKEICSLIMKVSAATKPPDTESAELFMMSLADCVEAAQVTMGATAVVPLNDTAEDKPFDITHISSVPHAYIELKFAPGKIMTYGTIVCYSPEATSHFLDIGSLVKFPTPTVFLIAKEDLLSSIEDVKKGTSNSSTTVNLKRTRSCLSVDDGDQTVAVQGEKMTMYIIDLEGVRHPTRNKTDVAQREKDLAFAFRAMDSVKWPFFMTSDCTVQVEEYLSVLLEQGKTREIYRNPAFHTCSLLDRIGDVSILKDKGKLKNLLIGNFRVGADATITLNDFVPVGVKVSSGQQICTNHNRTLVVALVNFEIAMQILFSESFDGTMAQLISALEGVKRPLELVTSDFLVHTVELAMSRFFRAARTEKGSSMDPPNCMNSPAACSTYLKQIITQVIDSLSDHSQRIVDEAHYRAWITKDRANSPEARNKKASKPIQICAAHFGSEFGAMNSLTKKPYKCAYGVKCMFSHEVQKGKTPTELADIIGQLPAAMRADLTKAVSSKVVLNSKKA